MASDIIFPTLLWSFKYPDTGQLAGYGSRVIELRKGDPQGISITNLGGWHSKTNLLDDQAFHRYFSGLQLVASKHLRKSVGILAWLRPHLIMLGQW